MFRYIYFIVNLDSHRSPVFKIGFLLGCSNKIFFTVAVLLQPSYVYVSIM